MSAVPPRRRHGVTSCPPLQSSVVYRDRRIGLHSQEVDVLVADLVDDPQVLARNTPCGRSPRAECDWCVGWRGQHFCTQERLHRCADRSVPRRAGQNAQPGQRSLESGAQPGKSSDQGGTPVSAQRSTSAIDRTLHSPRSISSTARCSSCSSSPRGFASRAPSALDSKPGSVGLVLATW